MFGIGPATRIYLATGSTDMRKGFEGLFGLFVELVQQLQPRRLFFRCAVGGRLEVHNRRTTRPELRALVCRRHIAVAPIGRGRAATR
jgi:hypothetical protein